MAEPDPAKTGAPVLLAGGNPQIAKGYGDKPVQDYIAAMPGWKRDVGREVDAIVSRTIRDVRKAVKWNSPLYGVSEGEWFLSMHCMTKYVKLAFFQGAALEPAPPVGSKQPMVRYWHIYEGEPFDTGQFTDWVSQASLLPGERM